MLKKPTRILPEPGHADVCCSPWPFGRCLLRKLLENRVIGKILLSVWHTISFFEQFEYRSGGLFAGLMADETLSWVGDGKAEPGTNTGRISTRTPMTFLAVLGCEIWEVSPPDAPGNSAARKWAVGGGCGSL